MNSTLSDRFLMVAVGCALVGMGAGIGMAVAENFALAPAHAHLNLLGWVTLALYGLYYRATPEAAVGLLPRLHFWLATAGIGVMIPAVAWRVLGHPEAEAIIGSGALMVVAAMALFGVVVVRQRRKPAMVRDAIADRQDMSPLMP